MIRVMTDTLDEARRAARLLRDAGPGKPYRVFLKGEEFTLDGELPTLAQCRVKARQLLRDAGPAGMSLDDLHVRLYKDGFRVSKSTVYRWLDRWADDGDVRNPRRGRWIWVTGRAA